MADIVRAVSQHVSPGAAAEAPAGELAYAAIGENDNKLAGDWDVPEEYGPNGHLRGHGSPSPCNYTFMGLPAAERKKSKEEVQDLRHKMHEASVHADRLSRLLRSVEGDLASWCASSARVALPVSPATLSPARQEGSPVIKVVSPAFSNLGQEGSGDELNTPAMNKMDSIGSRVPGQGGAAPSRAAPELLSFWSETAGERIHDRFAPALNCTTTDLPTTRLGKAGDVLAEGSFFERLVFRPSAIQRMTWDVLSLMAITYDMLTLPLTVFDFDTSKGAWLMSLITTSFWTVDILLNFFVGYHKLDGRIELRPSRIARRYLKTWFVPDVTIVTVDWWLFDIDDMSAVDVARLGKSLRITRVVRLLRIIRIVKFMRLFEELSDFIFSGTLLLTLNIVRLLAGLGVISHFLACAWYAMATIISATSTNWVTAYFDQNEDDGTMLYRYVLSYHWIMGQFTPAPVNIHPSNALERIFAIAVLFVGFVMFSSFLGSVTSHITTARQVVFDRLRSDSLVRQFLLDNRVSLDLGNQITVFQKEHRRKKTRVIETDVKMLKHLPESLLTELRYEIFSRKLQPHPFFSLVDRHDRSTIAEICHNAATEKVYAKHDEPFSFRAEAQSMLIVTSGSCIYFPWRMVKKQQPVKEDQWVCEAALWVRWNYKGLLVAQSSCCLLEIDSMLFRGGVARRMYAMTLMRQYALIFHQTLRTAYQSSRQVDDLWTTRHSLEELEDLLGLRSETAAQVQVPSDPASSSFGLRSLGMRSPKGNRRSSTGSI